MLERTPQTPPVILPVTNDDSPLWSVMIPAYNCYPFLKETILSVLAQDEGEEQMQIEVIDDDSTDGDVAALVLEIGKGRVHYFKQQQNVGSLRNFETCLNRAKGKWIHILHGDDMVKKDFYAEIESLFNIYPQAGAAFTKSSYINEKGYEKGIEKQVQDEPGIVRNWLYIIAARNRLQPPCMVVKRVVYEKLGGFFAVHYGEDWEMWTRIAAHYPVAYSPRCLAMYRVHGQNISSTALTNGQFVKDLKKVVNIIQGYLPMDKRKSLKKQALKTKSVYFARNAKVVYAKNPNAALKQARRALQLHFNIESLGFVLLLYLKHLKHKTKR